jgi:hypothetical protein
MGKYMKTKKGSIESSILEVWKNAAEQTEAEKLHRPSYELGTDEYTEYTKNLTPGQEVTQKLDEKGLPPWLDKNKKKDDDDDDDKKSSKKGNLPPWLKGKGKDKKEALSPKQKKLDVDGDGDIEGDDLADLRNKKKKSESYRARETWKEAIKKVVEYSKDKQEEDEVKGKKTMTGGKKADVQINPDIEKEEHGKKKPVKAGYTY